MLSQKNVLKDENRLRLRVNKLSDNNKKIFYKNIENELKDPDSYAVLNFVFLTGLHHFYLKEWLKGGINLILFISAFVLIFSGHSSLFGMGLGFLISVSIIELNDLFQSQIIVKDYNNKVYNEALIGIE